LPATYTTAGVHYEQGQIGKAQIGLDKTAINQQKNHRITSILKRLHAVAGTELTPVCLEMVIQDVSSDVLIPNSRTTLHASYSKLPDSKIFVLCRTHFR